MADKIYGFDSEGFRRVANAVRRVEGTPSKNLPGPSWSKQVRNRTILGRITGNNDLAHSWEQVVPTAEGGHDTITGGISGDATIDPMRNPAYERNGGIAEVDTIVELSIGHRSFVGGVGTAMIQTWEFDLGTDTIKFGKITVVGEPTTPGDPIPHSWIEQRPIAGGKWEDMPDGIVGDAEADPMEDAAYAMDGTAARVDDYYWFKKGRKVSTTLDGGIGEFDSTIIVTDGSDFPAGSFVIQIGSEKILVSSRSGNTFSDVTRGYDGTTAAAHDDGAAVECLTTDWRFEKGGGGGLHIHVTDCAADEDTGYHPALITEWNVDTHAWDDETGSECWAFPINRYTGQTIPDSPLQEKVYPVAKNVGQEPLDGKDIYAVFWGPCEIIYKYECTPTTGVTVVKKRMIWPMHSKEIDTGWDTCTDEGCS